MPRPEHNYSEDQRDQALMILARHNGNAPKALAELKERLPDAPGLQTLYDWRDKHAQRYQEIREEIAPQIERQAITTYRDIVVRSAQGQLLATEQTITDLENGSVKDASVAARNLAIAGGVATDKLLLFTNRPTQITHTAGPDELLAKLTRVLGPGSIDSTAVEIDSETEALP